MSSLESLNNNTTQICSIRDRNLPEYLVPIREAIICISDYLHEVNDHLLNPEDFESLTTAELLELADRLGINLKEVSGSERKEIIDTHADELESAFLLHYSVVNNCNTVRGIKTFLELYYPHNYESKIFLGRLCDYFNWHEVIVIKDIKSGKYLGLSTSSIFNNYKPFAVFGKKDAIFTYPYYKDQPFQRLTDIIVSESEVGVFEAFKEIEGTDSKWEEGIYDDKPVVSYRYRDSANELHIVDIDSFIREHKV